MNRILFCEIYRSRSRSRSNLSEVCVVCISGEWRHEYLSYKWFLGCLNNVQWLQLTKKPRIHEKCPNKDTFAIDLLIFPISNMAAVFHACGPPSFRSSFIVYTSTFWEKKILSSKTTNSARNINVHEIV